MGIVRSHRGSIHLVLVTLQDRDVVSDHEENRILQLAFGGSLKHTLGFFETVQQKIRGGKTAIRKSKVGLNRDLLQGCLDRSFKSARPVCGKAA